MGIVLLFGTSLHFLTSATGQNKNNEDHHQFNQPPLAQQRQMKSFMRGTPPQISFDNAKMALQTVRAEFNVLYGGQVEAEKLYSKTITAYGDIQETADRILRAIARQDDFVMGFAGYSITVGRGNYFKQSFPFVVERVLANSMKALGVPKFYVRNSAIGG